jgi:hypothetical protein
MTRGDERVRRAPRVRRHPAWHCRDKVCSVNKADMIGTAYSAKPIEEVSLSLPDTAVFHLPLGDHVQ